MGANSTRNGTGKPTSGIEIPEQGVDFYHPKDVPHGEVRSRWYKSEVTGQTRHIMVYTPPGYDADPQKRWGGCLEMVQALETASGDTTGEQANQAGGAAADGSVSPLSLIIGKLVASVAPQTI